MTSPRCVAVAASSRKTLCLAKYVPLRALDSGSHAQSQLARASMMYEVTRPMLASPREAPCLGGLDQVRRRLGCRADPLRVPNDAQCLV